MNSLKKAREDGMKKRLLIVDGWDIAVDDDYVNSLDSKINDVKNTFGISIKESEDNTNESKLSLIDKNNSHDTNLFLRLKGLGKRQIEKVGFIVVVSYIFIFILNWEIIHALKHVKYFVYLRVLLGHGLKRNVTYQFGYQ